MDRPLAAPSPNSAFNGLTRSTRTLVTEAQIKEKAVR
jgi:hypothetical protein